MMILYKFVLYLSLIHFTIAKTQQLVSFHIKPSTKNWRSIFQHLKKEIYNQWWWETLNPTLMLWFSVYQSHLNHHMHFFILKICVAFVHFIIIWDFIVCITGPPFFMTRKAWISKLGSLLNFREKSLLKVSYDFLSCLVYNIKV